MLSVIYTPGIKLYYTIITRSTSILEYDQYSAFNVINWYDFGLFSSHEGVDEATIVEVLAKRSNAQRQQLKEAYQQSTGKVSIFTSFNI